MSEATGQKRTDRIKLESICNDEESMGFYASFEDGLSIQYEPAGRVFHPTKRTLWIRADPAEVDIAFFDDQFEQGFNTPNETGVWLSYGNRNLLYHEDVVHTVGVYEADAYNESDHLGCPSWPNCREAGCGEW